MDKVTAGLGARRLRIIVLVLAGIETAIFVVIEFIVIGQMVATSEHLSASIALAVVAGLALPFVLFTLPALILGLRRQRLGLALSLAILAVLVTLAIRYFM